PVAPATRWPVAPTTYPLPEVPARPPVPPGPPRPPVSPEPPAPGPLAPSRPPRRPEESGLPVGAPAAEPRGLDDPTGTFTRALLTGLGGGAETTSAAPVRPRRRSEPVTATERALARAGDGWATTVATARRLGGRLAALRGDERTALLAVVAVVGVVLLAIVVLLVAARLTAGRPVGGATSPAAAAARPSQGRHGPSVAPSRTGSPLPPAGGSFAARHSGLCLAPPVGRKDEGAQLVQRTCGTDPAAGFHLVAAGGRADAYALVDAGTGRCADVLGGGEGDSVPVVQWECHGADNQTFELRPVPGLDGYVQIVADHSGKCVDVTGASKDEGAPIQQYACHDPATEARMGNQAWRLTPG
ncbi:MAG TPA: RICIN domain-containing protein, partial [Mycobacteriales bacterium]|nr:RICIN domain-containing protein [Mycobacteriales bacterium]